jgi:hypothetical protein
LRILESTTPCGYGHITLNGQSLGQDDSGIGYGSITTESGNVLLADWKLSCVHLEQDLQNQLLSFHIVSIDGQEVQDVSFSVQFRQTAPVSIFYVDGATAQLRSSSSSSNTNSLDNRHPSLEKELAELEILKQQLLILEHSIVLKIEHISETFNFDRPEELLQVAGCNSIKCIFKTMYNRMKGMASKFSGGHGEHGPLSSQTAWLSPYHGHRLATTPAQLSLDRQHQYPPPEIDDSRKEPDSIPSPQELGLVSSQDEAEHPIFTAHEGAGHPYHRLNQPFINHESVSSDSI